MNCVATLNMPNNYVVMEQEEMMYIDGGWSGEVFKDNILGLYANYRQASFALRAGGIGVGTIYQMANMTAPYIIAKFGITLSTTATIVGGVVAGLITAAGISAAVYYLGNHSVFG